MFQKIIIDKFLGLDANAQDENIQDNKASNIINLRFDRIMHLVSRNGVVGYPVINPARIPNYQGSLSLSEFVFYKPSSSVLSNAEMIFSTGNGIPPVGQINPFTIDSSTRQIITSGVDLSFNDDRATVLGQRDTQIKYTESSTGVVYDQATISIIPFNVSTANSSSVPALLEFYRVLDANYRNIPTTRFGVRADRPLVSPRRNLFDLSNYSFPNPNIPTLSIAYDLNWIEHYQKIAPYANGFVVSDRVNGDMILIDRLRAVEDQCTKILLQGPARFYLLENCLPTFNVEDVELDFDTGDGGENDMQVGVESGLAMYKFYLPKRLTKPSDDKFTPITTATPPSQATALDFVMNLDGGQDRVAVGLDPIPPQLLGGVLNVHAYDDRTGVGSSGGTPREITYKEIVFDPTKKAHFTNMKTASEFDDLFGGVGLSNPTLRIEDEEDRLNATAADVFVWEDKKLPYYPCTVDVNDTLLTQRLRPFGKTESTSSKAVKLSKKDGAKQNAPLGVWRYRFAWEFDDGRISAASSDMQVPDMLWSAIPDEALQDNYVENQLGSNLTRWLDVKGRVEWMSSTEHLGMADPAGGPLLLYPIAKLPGGDPRIIETIDKVKSWLYDEDHPYGPSTSGAIDPEAALACITLKIAEGDVEYTTFEGIIGEAFRYEKGETGKAPAKSNQVRLNIQVKNPFSGIDRYFLPTQVTVENRTRMGCLFDENGRARFSYWDRPATVNAPAYLLRIVSDVAAPAAYVIDGGELFSNVGSAISIVANGGAILGLVLGKKYRVLSGNVSRRGMNPEGPYGIGQIFIYGGSNWHAPVGTSVIEVESSSTSSGKFEGVWQGDLNARINADSYIDGIRVFLEPFPVTGAELYGDRRNSDTELADWDVIQVTGNPVTPDAFDADVALRTVVRGISEESDRLLRMKAGVPAEVRARMLSTGMAEIPIITIADKGTIGGGFTGQAYDTFFALPEYGATQEWCMQPPLFTPRSRDWSMPHKVEVETDNPSFVGERLFKYYCPIGPVVTVGGVGSRNYDIFGYTYDPATLESTNVLAGVAITHTSTAIDWETPQVANIYGHARVIVRGEKASVTRATAGEQAVHGWRMWSIGTGEENRVITSGLSASLYFRGERLLLAEQLTAYFPSSILFGCPRVKIKIPLDKIPFGAKKLHIYRTRATHENEWQPYDFGLVEKVDIDRDDIGRPTAGVDFFDDVKDLSFDEVPQDLDGLIRPLKSRFVEPLNERVYYANIIETYQPQAAFLDEDHVNSSSSIDSGRPSMLYPSYFQVPDSAGEGKQNVLSPGAIYQAYNEDVNSIYSQPSPGIGIPGTIDPVPPAQQASNVLFGLPVGYDPSIEGVAVGRTLVGSGEPTVRIGIVKPEDEGVFLDDQIEVETETIPTDPPQVIVKNEIKCTDPIEEVNPSALRFSELDEPCWIKGQNLRTVLFGDGDQITGLTQQHGNLVVMKERSMHRLAVQGDYNESPNRSPDPISRIDEISKSIGCIAPNTLLTHDNIVYFLSWNGFMRYDNTVLQMADGAFNTELMLRMNDRQGRFQNPAIRDASCGYNAAYNEIYLNIPIAGQLFDRGGTVSVEGHIYVLSLKTGEVTKFTYTNPTAADAVAGNNNPRHPRTNGRLYYTDSRGRLLSTEILPPHQNVQSSLFVEAPTVQFDNDIMVSAQSPTINVPVPAPVIMDNKWVSKEFYNEDPSIIKRVRKVIFYMSARQNIRSSGASKNDTMRPFDSNAWTYAYAGNDLSGEFIAIPPQEFGKERGEFEKFTLESQGKTEIEFFTFYWKAINTHVR